MSETLNTDLARHAVVETAAMDWAASPSPTVWRKRAYSTGGETGRVTSVVRYDPGSTFPAHDHPEGEEILVLEGTFSDEHGDYTAGTFLLNPEGFRHAPRSEAGCVIFVKLRQYAGLDRPKVILDTTALSWRAGIVAGHSVMPLHTQAGYPERIALERLAPETRLPRHEHPEGAEIFVIDGTLADENGRYGAGTWLRNPPGSAHGPFSDTGCRYYVRTGGFT